MSILVTGATGRIGASVLKELLDAGVAARALSRDPARLALPGGIEIATGDLREPASVAAALQGIRAVFLYAQGDRPDELMTVMRGAGVEKVVVLSTIDMTNPHPYAQHNRRRHGAVEEAVAAAGFRYTFLRPGAFASNAQRFWGAALAAGDTVPIPFPEAAQAPISEHDIAAVAREALISSRLDEQALVLTGPESLTQRRQLEIVASATGRSLKVYPEPVEDARTRLAKIVPFPYVELLLAQWADEVGVPATVTNTVEQVTGRAATTFSEWARRHATALGAKS